MNLSNLINEIKNPSSASAHKQALDIYTMLENNRTKFLEKLDKDTYNHLLKNFESLSEARATEYNSTSYKDEFNRTYNLLLFYLDRII
ncbi:MAG: hypothetical protein KF900_05465 [Bacteroidetes bacterium]|nr:hypothetical protein [Bacteroidota bacterium]